MYMHSVCVCMYIYCITGGDELAAERRVAKWVCRACVPLLRSMALELHLLGLPLAPAHILKSLLHANLIIKYTGPLTSQNSC